MGPGSEKGEPRVRKGRPTLMQRKLFTVSEANRALPRLTHILRTLRDCYGWLKEHRQQPPFLVQKHQIINDSPVDFEYFQTLVRVRGLLREIEDIGVLVKDLSQGLVDFPSRLNGREIFLCWKLGEDRVGFFHDPEAGYAGRQPVPSEDDEGSGERGN